MAPPRTHDAHAEIAAISSAAELGRWLRTHIREHGLHVGTLAAQAGVSSATLYYWLKGEHLPPRPDVEETDRFYRLLALDEMALPEPLRLALDEVRLKLVDEPAAPPLRGLPGVVRHFAGRVDSLSELDALLKARDRASTVVICAVSGTGGVGKTALAVNWAHSAKVRRAFPQGYLYINLQGFSAGPPLTTAAALNTLLRELGVEPAQIPGDPDAMAALYQERLDRAAILVVLDNAHDEPQTRPLLPRSPRCLAVVTSRNRLAGLVASDGAVALSLDRLRRDEAVRLLHSFLGPAGSGQPAEAFTELADECVHLPLALRIAAATYLTADSRPPLADYVVEIRANRLERLRTSERDDMTAIRAVMSWSVRHLSAPVAHAFRTLGRHPGQDLDAYAAAALLRTDVVGAVRPLGELVAHSLLESTDTGRYQMHDLLHEYARELAEAAPDPEADIERLYAYYGAATAAAIDVVNPGERPDQPREDAEPTAEIPTFTSVERAGAWLDAERANLVAVAGHAADHGCPAHAIRQSRVLARHFLMRAHITDALALHGYAVGAARVSGDRGAEGRALLNLATVHGRSGQYAQAATGLEEALERSREVGDRPGEARALNNLGIVYELLGRYDDELAAMHQSVELFRASDPAGQGYALLNLGGAYERLGRYREALTHLDNAVAFAEASDNRPNIGRAAYNLGNVHLRLGELDRALDRFEQAVSIAAEVGDQLVEGRAINAIGTVYRRLGRYAEAAEQHRRSLAIAGEISDAFAEATALVGLGAVDGDEGRHPQSLDGLRRALALGGEFGHRSVETAALNSMGDVHSRADAPAEALRCYRRALAMAEIDRDRYEQARANDGIAGALDAVGDPSAQAHRDKARALFADLGIAGC